MNNYGVKDEIAAYWTRRAGSFDASPGHGIAAGAERAGWTALLRERLGALEGRSVLELAPGTGEFTSLLVEGGAAVTGLDLSEGMLARARAKVPGAALRLGDAEHTRERAGHFDAVVCRHLVWTLPEPEVALADWFRVLRPGGRLLIVDGDWVRVPLLGRVRQAVGRRLLSLAGHAPEPIDWAAHAHIMRQVRFRGGLRAPALAGLVRGAGFEAVVSGGLSGIRAAQRRAVGFPRSLVVGGYREFWMGAVRPL